MRKQSLFVKLCLSAMVFFVPIGMNAQVTIGSNNPPSAWSLLYLDASEQQRALHNARLTTDQRNALVTPDSDPAVQYAAMGLLLFNICNQCLEFWNGSQWISLCDGDTPRVNFPEDEITISGNLTAWTRVMYDFQRQRLWIPVSWTADVANNGNFQWQVSADGNRWFSIRGETNADFNIPVDFMYDVDDIRELRIAKGVGRPAPDEVDYNTRELYFRRVQTASGNLTASNPFNMLFIRTNTSGFSQEVDITLRSLEISPNRFGGPIRIALLNLGATNDNSLGDLFQWGRQADDHQIINWEKATNGANVFAPATVANTAANSTVTMANLDANGQVPSNHTGYGHFLTRIGTGDWVTGGGIANRNDLWGNGADIIWSTRVGHPTSLSDWTARGQANNPCPAGWRVPSHFDFFDMHDGNGSNNHSLTSGSYGTTDSGNTWQWRGVQAGTGAVGGAIVTNLAGEAVFLPAVGLRATGGSTLNSAGVNGYYWSSTFNTDVASLNLRFGNSIVNAGNGSSSGRSQGLSVRCVSDD